MGKAVTYAADWEARAAIGIDGVARPPRQLGWRCAVPARSAAFGGGAVGSAWLGQSKKGIGGVGSERGCARVRMKKIGNAPNG
jgi:hypothetical protein